VIADINIDNLLENSTDYTAPWKGHTPPAGQNKKVENTPGILAEVSRRLSIFIEQQLNLSSYTNL
jgi:hypothetical protein